MAVKKSTARRATKSSAKKVAKKSAPKAKKAVAKRAVTKKVAAKKSVVKKASAKKSAVKKSSVKKATVKKSAAKKAAVKKTTSAASLTVPAVPVGQVRTAQRTTVSSTPAAPKATPKAGSNSASASASQTKKDGASTRTFLVLVFAIVLLGLIVWSKSSSTTESAAPEATPTASAEATASQSPTAEASASATAEVTDATSTSAAPERFIGNFRNDGQTLLLTWRAPAGAEAITGYNVEVRPANGEWTSVEVVGADVFSYQLQKVSADSWSQFRVSAIYPDGQSSAKIFGFAGQWSK